MQVRVALEHLQRLVAGDLCNSHDVELRPQLEQPRNRLVPQIVEVQVDKKMGIRLDPDGFAVDEVRPP